MSDTRTWSSVLKAAFRPIFDAQRLDSEVSALRTDVEVIRETVDRLKQHTGLEDALRRAANGGAND